MADFHSEWTPMQFWGERQEPNPVEWLRLEQFGKGSSSRLFYNEVPAPWWHRHGGHLDNPEDVLYSSPTPTSSPKLASVLILPLQKVELPGLENMKPYPSSLQRSSRRRTSSTHINFQSKSPRSHTSKESGPPTDKPL